ncbi:DUF3833 family protein [uncultured Photobacterium sp.]|uniref:DUF3833 family protein n=1 Tax=uncultured Photobacterium sp. TaxID=173973 RepID=UPI00262BD8C6|nr:DUF3833 family protein [uncultured Photobacterium sp.]
MPLRELLIVGVLFNMYWLVSVVGQSQFIWLLVTLLLMCWWYYSDTWRFSLLLGGAGILMDLMLNKLGVFHFTQSFFPVWLALLWLGFGSFVWVIRQVIAFYSPYFMKQHRTWVITKNMDGYYVGRAEDVIGEATGHVTGNALNWQYVLRVPVGSTSYDISFDDRMFRQDDKRVFNVPHD